MAFRSILSLRCIQKLIRFHSFLNLLESQASIFPLKKFILEYSTMDNLLKIVLLNFTVLQFQGSGQIYLYEINLFFTDSYSSLSREEAKWGSSKQHLILEDFRNLQFQKARLIFELRRNQGFEDSYIFQFMKEAELEVFQRYLKFVNSCKIRFLEINFQFVIDEGLKP